MSFIMAAAIIAVTLWFSIIAWAARDGSMAVAIFLSGGCISCLFAASHWIGW